MKPCPKCKISKAEVDFYKNKSKKDGLDTYCKACRNESNLRSSDEHPETRRSLDKKKYKKYKDYINEFKIGKSCTDCNKMFPPYVMQFDHINPKNKLNNVAHMRNEKLILEEISKCDLVCANCHAVREHKRRDGV